MIGLSPLVETIVSATGHLVGGVIVGVPCHLLEGTARTKGGAATILATTATAGSNVVLGPHGGAGAADGNEKVDTKNGGHQSNGRVEGRILGGHGFDGSVGAGNVFAGRAGGEIVLDVAAQAVAVVHDDLEDGLGEGNHNEDAGDNGAGVADAGASSGAAGPAAGHAGHHLPGQDGLKTPPHTQQRMATTKLAAIAEPVPPVARGDEMAVIVGGFRLKDLAFLDSTLRDGNASHAAAHVHAEHVSGLQVSGSRHLHGAALHGGHVLGLDHEGSFVDVGHGE